MAKPKTGKTITVLYSPHIHTDLSLSNVMWHVNLALLPAFIASVIFFGFNSIRIVFTSIITTLLTELFIARLMKKKITIQDGSAFLTGLLFAFNMPPAAPWYVVVFGAFFSIAIVKMAFGGLGYNFMNPALGGRIFVMAAWPSIMINRWSPTITEYTKLGITMGHASYTITHDAITSATPLTVAKMEGVNKAIEYGFTYYKAFIGDIPGCIGETSALALLVGFVYLLYKKIITPEIPLVYIGTTALLTWIFGALPYGGKLFEGDPLFHILTGGLMLGAIFMATDYTTSPITPAGNIFYAIMLGILTVIIRLWGGYPEGVSYAIVIMNIFVPLIDKIFKSRIYGYKKYKMGD